MLSPAVNLRASLTQLGSRLSSTERTSAPLHLPRWVSRWSVFTSRTLAARESGKFWFWLSGSLGFRKVNARMRAHAEGLSTRGSPLTRLPEPSSPAVVEPSICHLHSTMWDSGSRFHHRHGGELTTLLYEIRGRTETHRR